MDVKQWVRNELFLQTQSTNGMWSAWTDYDGLPEQRGMFMCGVLASDLPPLNEWDGNTDNTPVAITFLEEDRQALCHAHNNYTALLVAIRDILRITSESGKQYGPDFVAGMDKALHLVHSTLTYHLINP